VGQDVAVMKYKEPIALSDVYNYYSAPRHKHVYYNDDDDADE
jgi:hypothetical protein